MLSVRLIASLSILPLSASSYKLAIYFSHLFDKVLTIFLGISRNKHNTSSLLEFTFLITGNRTVIEHASAKIEVMRIINIEAVSSSLLEMISSTYNSADFSTAKYRSL